MAPPPLRAHTMVGVSCSHNETCCATGEKITSAGQCHDKSDPHCTLILVHLRYLPVLGVPASIWLRDAASQWRSPIRATRTGTPRTRRCGDGDPFLVADCAGADVTSFNSLR